MKILVTTDVYKSSVNGVVTSVKNLIAGLEKDGHEVRVLTLSDSGRSYREGNVYYMGSFSAEKIYPGIRVVMDPAVTKIHELIKWNPDVIHSQCEFSTFVFAKIISERTGAPLVHTYHTVYEGMTQLFCPIKPIGVALVRGFSRVIANSTDGVVAPTDKIENMLRDYGVRKPLHVIPTGIELGKYAKDDKARRAEIRKKLGIGDDECVITSVGRVSKEKNIDEIVEFMADERTNNVRLLIVGDGPYRGEIEKLAKKVGVYDRIIFAGMVDHSEVADYYRAGDIFVCASTCETQGLTYMEAMAAGLALLCREDDAIENVVQNGENGFKYNNADEFAIYLNFLMNDRDLRKAMGRDARKTVLETYSVERFASKCERIYREVTLKKLYFSPSKRFRRKLAVLFD